MNKAFLFCAATLMGGAALAVSEIRSGELWRDTAGHVINAHGGGMMYDNGIYWWYGEHKVYGRAGNRAHVGVHAYSSANLIDWDDRGIALAVTDAPGDIEDGCVLERPKVIHNAKTGRYVMFFHLELKGRGYCAARTGIAVSDKPEGPFKFLRSLRPNASDWPTDVRPDEQTPEALAKSRLLGDESGGPNDRVRANIPYLGHLADGQMARDMTLFVDDDGTAYHVFASEYNSTLHVAELSADYLSYSGRWFRVAEKEWTEAPALCKWGGYYWLIGSGCTGWKPNAARLYRAAKLEGPWTNLGNPCKGINPQNGDGPERTWGAQSTYIQPIAGKPGRFMAMFDIWRPENQIDSRYAWLPITFTGDTLEIVWRDAWTPGE